MTTTVAPSAKDADVEARVDVASLTHQLLGRWGDLRLFARAIVGDPRFQKIEGMSVEEHRERVLNQLKLLVTEAKVLRAFPERLGGADDAGGSLAGFEELVAGTRRCRSSRACSGACSRRRSCTSAPPSSTTASCREP